MVTLSIPGEDSLCKVYSSNPEVLKVLQNTMLSKVLIMDFINIFDVPVGKIRDYDIILANITNFILDDTNHPAFLEYGTHLASQINCNGKCYIKELSGGKSTRMAKDVPTEQN